MFATMVPDSKKMDMPYVVAGTAKWLRDSDTETKKECFSCCCKQTHAAGDHERRVETKLPAWLQLFAEG